MRNGAGYKKVGRPPSSISNVSKRQETTLQAQPVAERIFTIEENAKFTSDSFPSATSGKEKEPLDREMILQPDFEGSTDDQLADSIDISDKPHLPDYHQTEIKSNSTIDI